MIILITGTSAGIGKYLAEYYSMKGFQVLGCSRRDSSISYSNYKHYKIDLQSESEIVDLFRSIRREYKSLDAVINNAAINPFIGSAALLSEETIIKTYKTNVFAPMIICREAVKIMSRTKFGRIINIGTMATYHEVPGESLYTSSKAALDSYSRILAKEMAKLNITVNILAPSAIETDLSKQINEDKLFEVLNRNAINTFGSMSDVSNLADLLLKKESSAITGQVIYLGGV